MNVSQAGDLLAKVLPAIRTRLQLAGLVVIVAAWMLVQFAQPGNTSAMLAGGAIGVSMIIFGQLFQFLRDFPERSRAAVFLGAFAMFCVLVLALLAATVILLRQPTMDVTLESEVGFAGGASNGTNVERTETNPQILRIALREPDLPKVFAPDQDDGQLRREADEFGTGVRYAMKEKNGVLEIVASMPYLRRMRGEGYIVPLTVDRFRWVPPVLSFKVSNPRLEPLLITKAKLEASSVVNEDEPVLIVHDAKPYRKPGATDERVRYYPLSFYNVSWGQVHKPVLRFSVVRDVDIEKAARGSFRHTVEMKSFDGELELDLTDYIDPSIARERTDPNRVLNELLARSAAVNYSGGASLEYLNVIGQLAFETQRGEARLTNFRAKIYFSTFGPGRVNPSYKYNVSLPEDVTGFPITVPLSQCVAGRSADNFLMAFNSPKSARYEMNINVTSTDGVALSKRVVLHTLVSRNYGLARPTKTDSFFRASREGCT